MYTEMCDSRAPAQQQTPQPSAPARPGCAPGWVPVHGLEMHACPQVPGLLFGGAMSSTEGEPQVMVMAPADPESWHVQVWSQYATTLHCCCPDGMRRRNHFVWLPAATSWYRALSTAAGQMACLIEKVTPEMSACVSVLAQILRSIDSDSADGFPSQQAEAMQMGLDSGKGKIIEYSIQKARSQHGVSSHHLAEALSSNLLFLACD